MKRIITLVLLAGAFTAANAQPSRNDDRRVVIDNGSHYPGNNGRDVIIGNGPNVGSYPSNKSYGFNRQFEIDRVNREYDARIQSVWNDRYLRRGEKKRITSDLERERQLKIDEINRHGNDWDHDHRNDHRDNGWNNRRY